MVADELGRGSRDVHLLLLDVQTLRHKLVLARQMQFSRPRARRRRSRALEFIHELLRDLLDLVLSTIPLLPQRPVSREILADDVVPEVVRPELLEPTRNRLRIELVNQMLAAENLVPRQRLLHDTAEVARRAAGGALLAELERDLGQLGHLVDNPLLRRGVLEQRDILEESLDDLAVMIETVFRQSQTARELARAGAERRRTRAQLVDPALRLQIRQKTPRALVADQMADIMAGLRLPQVLLVRVREVQIQLPLLHDRLDEDLNAQPRLVENRNTVPPQLRQVLIRHIGEKLLDPALQFVQLFSAQHDQLHAVRRVMLLVKIDKRISNLDAALQRVVVQRLVVTRREIVVRVFFARQCAVQLEHAPLVALQVLFIL